MVKAVTPGAVVLGAMGVGVVLAALGALKVQRAKQVLAVVAVAVAVAVLISAADMRFITLEVAAAVWVCLVWALTVLVVLLVLLEVAVVVLVARAVLAALLAVMPLAPFSALLAELVVLMAVVAAEVRTMRAFVHRSRFHAARPQVMVQAGQ